MRIARYFYQKEETYGVFSMKSILSLPALAKHFKKDIPQKLKDFIAEGEKNLEKTEQMLKCADSSVIRKVSKHLSRVSLLPPIPFPPKIICLGLNYFDHAAERKLDIPSEPIIFLKPHTAITGPNKPIIKPKFVKELDYEGELCIVVGKMAKDVSVTESKKHVFGYTVFNDVSARDYQYKDGQWTRGKGFDTFAPTGPCITSENQLRNTENLAIRTWVNGELRQNGTTRNMVFNISEIIYHLSRVMTLEPCDIIATGTPSGVGFAMKPKQFLEHGDIVRIEIEGIGILENQVCETTHKGNL